MARSASARLQPSRSSWTPATTAASRVAATTTTLERSLWRSTLGAEPMEAEDTPSTTPPSGDPLSGEEVRRATFPQALRGYDRQAVHDMLDRVADWMEGSAGAISSATPDMREEIA